MARPRASCHADRLGALLAAARDAANRALGEQAGRRRPAADPPFVYAAAPGRPPQSIPAARFQRPYALTLAAVVLTLPGYCLLRKAGWERRDEAVFALGRPPLWRRLLRRAVPLALHVGVRDGAVSVSVGTAARYGAPDPGRRHILLAPDLQHALLDLHRAQLAARAFRFRAARNRHETRFPNP
jgi:hypothetical protein